MDVIWNLTKVCPWDCAVCSVSAIHVCDTTADYIYSKQKEEGKELTLAEKLTVLKSLVDRDFDIDFSGGDPLYYDEDFRIVEQSIRWLPSQKISVSTTGSNLTGAKLELLKKVGAVEFTLDNLLEMENPFRPRGYNLASMMAMKRCVAAGIKIRAITVLYQTTISQENLESIYYWLCDNAISEWELLRFYPAGRSIKLSGLTPSNLEYLNAMKFLRGLHGSTKILFQHSLKIIEKEIKCPAVIESIGVLPGGEVTACAWAMDDNTRPFKEFYLGKLPEDDLDEIIDRARKTLEYSERVKFCRTIAYIEKKYKKGGR